MSGGGPVWQDTEARPARRPWMLRLTDRPGFDRFRNRRARRAIVVLYVGVVAGMVALAASAPPGVMPSYVWPLLLPAVVLLTAATGGTTALYDRYLDEHQQARRDAAFRRFHPVSLLLIAVGALVVAPAALSDGVTPGVALAAVLVLVLVAETPSLLLAWTMPDEHGTARGVPAPAAPPPPRRGASRLEVLTERPLGRLLRRPLLRQVVVVLHAVVTVGLAVAITDEPAIIPGMAAAWSVLTVLLVAATGGLLWRRDRDLDERLRAVRDRSYFRGHLAALLWQGVVLVAASLLLHTEGVDAEVLRIVGAYAVVTFAAAPVYV